MLRLPVSPLANAWQLNFLRCLSGFVFGAAWLVVCAVATQALDPQKAATQYVHDVWTTRDGLPQDTINSIAQDGDGYIWFGTQEGLVRFDAVNFAVFDKRNVGAFKYNGIQSLFVDREGALWVGASDGMLRYRGAGAFEFFGERNGLPQGNSVKNFSEDAAGNLWLGYSVGDQRGGGGAGLYRFKNNQATAAYTKENGLSNNQVKRTFSDKDGALWIATGNGLNRLRDGKLTVYTTAHGLSDDLIRIVYADAAGDLWVGTPSGLNLFRDGRFTAYTTKDGLTSNSITVIYEDRDGTLWVGTEDGLNRIIDNKIEAVEGIEGFENNQINALLEDREGSLWIGTSAGGVHRLRDSKFTVFGAPEGVLGDAVNAIYETRNGSIVIGTSPGGLSVSSGGRFKTFSVADGLSSDKIRAVIEDRAGALWIGTGKGLNRFKDGKFTSYTSRHGLTNESVRSLYEARDGTIWIGTSGGGLSRFVDGKIVPFPNFDRFGNKFIHTIREDRTGRIWVGMDEDTGYFQNGTFTVHPATELKEANVQCIHEDADGTLWFATWGQGLLRLKNEILTVYTSKDGLFDDTQWSIIADDAGNLWMGSNRGVFSVSKQELEDFAEGRIGKFKSTVYGVSDGMRKSENNAGNPSATRTRDGRLWFSTTAGAAVIDPKNIRTNPVAPPVVLEQVLVDEQVIAPNGSPTIAPGARTLEFRYAGLSFVQPAKVKYRYRLEGFDSQWIDAGTRRAAFYTNLPPGDYVFAVIAANNDGVWNGQGAAMRFRVLAPFWRTWWFYGLSSLAIAGVAGLFYRWRINRLERARAAQQRYSQQLIESQERERKRIAVELHDGLGQSLVVIKNRALIGLNQPQNHDGLLAQMNEISESVSHTIAEVRDIARNLHPYQIEYLGLTGALKALIKTAADTSNIRFSVELDELAAQLPPDQEINLYRIVQEGINNVVKHSGATRARVSLRNKDRLLTLLIEDNGKGLSGKIDDEQRGLGLVGMAERAKILDADYGIAYSEAGTIIRLQMNLSTPETQPLCTESA